jgi:hypothetical protein
MLVTMLVVVAVPLVVLVAAAVMTAIAPHG